MAGMKILLICGLLLLASGAFITFGPMASALGLLLMLFSLAPLFLGFFIYLLQNSEQTNNGSPDRGNDK